ncbi:MAG: hypothetical protein ACRDH7_09315 [Actinomycetota bacterium]
MGFGVPNVQDVGAFPIMARVYSQDWEIIGAGIGGITGFVSGCAVTQTASPSMAVQISAGIASVNYAVVEIDAVTSLPLSDSDPDLDRIDMVVVDSDGAVSIASGTAAETPTPAPIPADSAVAAFIAVPAGDTAITDLQIADKRVPVPVPLSPQAWSFVSAASPAAVNNSATLAADPELTFAMGANKTYRVRLHADYDYFDGTGIVGSNLKVGFTLPTSPTKARLSSKGGSALVNAVRVAITPQFYTYNAQDAVGINLGGIQSSHLAGQALFELDGLVVNGSNAGAFTLTHSQRVAVAEDTVRLAGSYLEWMEV